MVQTNTVVVIELQVNYELRPFTTFYAKQTTRISSYMVIFSALLWYSSLPWHLHIPINPLGIYYTILYRIQSITSISTKYV